MCETCFWEHIGAFGFGLKTGYDNYSHGIQGQRVTPTFSTCIKVYFLVKKYLPRIIFKINYFAKHKIWHKRI